MVDPFDLENAPLGEPLAIAIGQSAQWRKLLSIDDTLFGLAYVMRRYLPGAALDQTIDLVNVSTDTWAVDIEPADIATWEAGKFFWDLVVTRLSDSRARVIETGEIQVFATDSDRRSHAHVMLDKIEALLAGKADNDMAGYTIKSRSITKMTTKELMEWRDYYRRELANSAPLIGDTARRGNRNSLRVRFRD